MDEEFRRRAEHGDGSWRSGTGHGPRLKKKKKNPRVDIFIPTTAIQISGSDPELLTAKTRVCRQNEETRKGKGIWSPSTASDVAPHLVKVMCIAWLIA